MTTHPERRAGQTWTDNFGFEYTLTRYDYNVSRWQATSSHTGTIEIPMPLDFSRLNLLSDAPAVAPVAADTYKAPDGYVPCKRNCGRWTFVTGSMAPVCWGCHKIHRESASGRANEAEHPDWTPPIAAQTTMTLISDVPAVAPVAADRTVPPALYEPCPEGCGSYKHVLHLRCWSCHTARGYRGFDASIGDQPDWTPPLAAQPAPQPEPAKGPMCSGCLCSKSDVIDCRFNERDRRWCGGCREKALKWSAAQSGTPYKGPERIARPRLAHVANLHDDDLIGGAR